MFLTGDALSPAMTAGEERMETPGDVAVMLRLAELGWGSKRIAAELGCSRTTVKRYLRQGGWASYRGRGRPSALAGLEGWLAERFRQHRGNADVVRQELAREHGIRVSHYGRSSGRWLICAAICLPRRGRACASRRRRAGSCRSISARRSSRSAKRWCGSICSWRRWATRAAGFVAAVRHERQTAWFEGLERAFRHFGGVPREVLLDNAKPRARERSWRSLLADASPGTFGSDQRRRLRLNLVPAPALVLAALGQTLDEPFGYSGDHERRASYGSGRG